MAFPTASVTSFKSIKIQYARLYTKIIANIEQDFCKDSSYGKTPTQEYESEGEHQMENVFTDFNFPNPRPLSKTIRHFLPGASQCSQFVTFTEKPNPVSTQTQQHKNSNRISFCDIHIKAKSAQEKFLAGFKIQIYLIFR